MKLKLFYNQLNNVSFYAGDIKEQLNNRFIQQHEKPQLVITDPPRSGMHPDVVNKLLEIHPERIVYISCNPATQARDVALMHAHYEVQVIQAVDMFPHTHHVENIALLQKR